MPEFISKLQHNTYEKGEFTDEEVRDVEETLHLVRTFPYDRERTGTDIQLTGPSVTIQDEYVNYLKVGLYFNGKLCIYYLDRDNHLYEYHAADVDDAANMVKDYFTGQLNLQKFDRHLFNIGNRPHFVTNHFEYRIKFWPYFLFASLLLLLLIILVSMIISSRSVALSLFPMIIFLVITICAIYYNIFINKDTYLQISKGSDTFLFGNSESDAKTYNKADILKFEIGESRNQDLLGIYELYLKNGEVLRISSLLIKRYDLLKKFSDAMGNLKIVLVYVRHKYGRTFSRIRKPGE